MPLDTGITVLVSDVVDLVSEPAFELLSEFSALKSLSLSFSLSLSTTFSFSTFCFLLTPFLGFLFLGVSSSSEESSVELPGSTT